MENYYIEECIKIPEPENFARYLHYKYKENFRCTSIKSKCWESKENDLWKANECGHSLYRIISNELLKDFIGYKLGLESEIIKLKKTSEVLETSEVIKNIQEKLKKITKIEKLLKNTTFKNKIMKENSFLFYT